MFSKCLESCAFFKIYFEHVFNEMHMASTFAIFSLKLAFLFFVVLLSRSIAKKSSTALPEYNSVATMLFFAMPSSRATFSGRTNLEMYLQQKTRFSHDLLTSFNRVIVSEKHIVLVGKSIFVHRTQ